MRLRSCRRTRREDPKAPGDPERWLLGETDRAAEVRLLRRVRGEGLPLRDHSVAAAHLAIVYSDPSAPSASFALKGEPR